MARIDFDYIWTDKKRTFLGLPLSFTRYILTEKKLITQTGFLSIHEDELDRIDEAAADLYGAAQSGDFETYCAARERLMAFLPTLADGEKPSFRRVF